MKQKPKSSLADLYENSLFSEESMDIITTFYKFFQYELCLQEFKETDLIFVQEIEEIKKQKQKVDINDDTIQHLNKKVNLEIVSPRNENFFKFQLFTRKKLKKEILIILENFGIKLNLLHQQLQIQVNINN